MPAPLTFTRIGEQENASGTGDWYLFHLNDFGRCAHPKS